jgi:hypothetical protein
MRSQIVKLRHFYLLACAIGALWPLCHLAQFILVHGLDMPEFIAELRSTPVGSLFGADVLVSALILVVFVRTEGRRLGLTRSRLPLLGLLVGVSLALPWFLYLRQRHLDEEQGVRKAREALA